MSLSDPWNGMIEATPSNSDALPSVGTGIYVWEDGDLEFRTMAGQSIGPYPVVAGQVIPCRVTHILEGTDATVTVGYI